jgi:hypothetical protein
LKKQIGDLKMTTNDKDEEIV